MTFSPDDTGIANGNFFGLPFTVEESALVLIPVPWDVTVSYNAGAANGPAAIIEASIQVEIFDQHAPDAWQKGIGTLEPDAKISLRSEHYRKIAEEIISHIEQGGDIKKMEPDLAAVNKACEEMNNYVFAKSTEILDKGKIVGVVGGDHSTPLGLIRALADKYESFGILHIDSHCDLRTAYEGFEYSHASIMHNAMKLPQIEKLVQVAVRDFSQAELLVAEADHRIIQFADYQIKEAMFIGETWHAQCEKIVAELPYNVYISFDIDGLGREYCPGTGTPVPGGLSFNEAVYLLVMVQRSGRKIIGFDLNEVSPSPDNEWDANVGARVLYKLCNLTLAGVNTNSQFRL